MSATRHRAVVAIVALTCLATLGACGETTAPEATIVLDAAPLRITPGQAVRLFVTNAGADILEFGPCDVRLQRRAGYAWVAARMLPCTDPLHQVVPRATRQLFFVPPPDSPPGMYRLHLRTAVSNAFTFDRP